MSARQFYRVTKSGFSFPAVYAAGDFVLLTAAQAKYFLAPYQAMLEPVGEIEDGGTAEALATFRRTYLGAATTDPPATLDGEALPVGAQYWNTTTARMRVLTADGWADKDAAAVAAGAAAVASAAAAADSATYAESARRDAQVIRDSVSDAVTAAATSADAAATSAEAAAGDATIASNAADEASASAAAAAASAAAAAGWISSDWSVTDPEAAGYIANKPTTLAGYGIADAVPASEKGAAGGVATLDGGGKIPESQIPAVAITDVYTAADQAAMLALAAERGDVAVRTDINKTFALAAAPATVLANWVELRTPTDAVLSVAGRTGAVALVKGDVGLGNVDNTSDADKPVSTAQQAALNTKAPLASPQFVGPLLFNRPSGEYGSSNPTWRMTYASVNIVLDAWTDAGGSAVLQAGYGAGHILLNPNSGNVGIGLPSPGQKLSVAGTIESTTGGVKFPNGTIQTTAATPKVDLLGSWDYGGAVAYVEVTFVPDAYAAIMVEISNISGTATAGLQVGLRHAGGSIAVVATGSYTALATLTAHVEFAVSLAGATKGHLGIMTLYDGTSAMTEQGGGSSATSPDRVRVNFSSGNIDAGSIRIYGIKAA